MSRERESERAGAAHWQHVYETKDESQVSWFRPHLDKSLKIITRLIGPSDPLIDVGGGASTLVDDLLARGFQHVTVLDLSRAALDVAQKRLGQRARFASFVCADVFEASFSDGAYALWHDRAVFHFFTAAADRMRYVALAARAVRKGGHVVLGAFAKDGPKRCSGLDVEQHDEDSVRSVFSPAFQLVHSDRETHRTPSGAEQRFAWFTLERA